MICSQVHVRTFTELLPEERVAPSLTIKVDTVTNETQADTGGSYCPRRLRQHDGKTQQIGAVNMQPFTQLTQNTTRINGIENMARFVYHLFHRIYVSVVVVSLKLPDARQVTSRCFKRFKDDLAK